MNEPKLFYLRYLLCVSVRRLVRFMNSFKHFAFSISILLVLCFLRWRRHQDVANVEMFCKAETGWRSANILHHFAPLCPRPCAAPRRLYWHRMPRRQQSCSAAQLLEVVTAVTSAAYDPSVSQSAFTITEKTPTGGFKTLC